MDKLKQEPETSEDKEPPCRLARWMRRLGIALTLCGAVGWFGAVLKCAGLFDLPGNIEVPLGDLEGIAVDADGNIYCGTPFWQRVQVYDQEGSFIRGWSVDAGGGMFRIRTDKDGYIHAATARGGMHYTYRPDGTLVSEAEEPELLGTFQAYSIVADDGSRYDICSPNLFPNIVKTDENGQSRRVVGPRWHLWLIQGPFPAFILFAVGVLMLAASRNISDLFLIPKPSS